MLEHGVQNEVNALATLLGKVLPAYYPNLAYVEEGCTVLKKDGKSFLVVSPDGSGRAEAAVASFHRVTFFMIAHALSFCKCLSTRRQGTLVRFNGFFVTYMP